MEISRLFFSKDTQEKMNQELTPAQKSKLRWEKLKDAEDRGILHKAKNRYEVANLVGFPETERNRGYQWVANLIRRHHLTETTLGISKNGRLEFEYHTASMPDFEHKNLINANKKQKKIEAPKKIETLSHHDRGKNRFEKLIEAEKNGKLANAKTRVEVARLAGMEDETYKTSYSWVSNLIARGHIIETPLQEINGRRIMSSYKIGNIPEYSHITKNNTNVVKTEKPQIPKVIEIVPDNKPIKIEISRGDTIIKLELDDYDKVGELIKNILKGE